MQQLAAYCGSYLKQIHQLAHREGIHLWQRQRHVHLARLQKSIFCSHLLRLDQLILRGSAQEAQRRHILIGLGNRDRFFITIHAQENNHLIERALCIQLYLRMLIGHTQ